MSTSRRLGGLLTCGAILLGSAGCPDLAEQIVPGPFTADVFARVFVRRSSEPFRGVAGQSVTITFQKLDSLGRSEESSEIGPTVVQTDATGWAEWSTRYTLTAGEKAWVRIVADDGIRLYEHEESKGPNTFLDESEVQDLGFVVTITLDG